MKNFFLASIFLLGIIETNAQTISLTSVTPNSSSDGQGTSLRIGTLAGNGASLIGGGNSFVGYYSGAATTDGSYNSFFGNYSGSLNTVGVCNSFFGSHAGSANVIGSENTYIGQDSGNKNLGNGNTFLGSRSGSFLYGSNNVLIGAGVSLGSVKFGEITVNNKLAIDNSNTTTPLIWGDFANDQLKFNGNVSIGTQLTPGGYKLAVGGKIIAEELKIQLQISPWPDYVFSSDYKLPTLEEVEKQIKEKGHLANVPSASEIEKNGYEIGNMTTIQQEKIEELTLYIIEQNKINYKQNIELEKQRKEIEELKIALKSLLDKKQ